MKVYEKFLKVTLKAHSKNPIELELGCIPLRHVIMSQRLNFLNHLIDQKKKLLHKVFKTQVDFPVKEKKRKKKEKEVTG